MSQSKQWQCAVCGKNEKSGSETGEPPICCQQAMQPVEPLPVCTYAEDPEHARLGADDEPCDDGRAG